MGIRGSGFAVGAIALLALGVPASQTRADQLAGFVQSVNADARKMVVSESGTDRRFDVAVDDRTQFVTDGGLALSFRDLKRGDGVGIALFNGLATSIVVNQAVLKGTVDTLDLDGKKMVISETESDRDLDVPIRSNTVIESTSGKVLDFKDIKTGDGVAVSYAGSAPIRIVVNPKPAELRGHVESVGADLKSLVIKEVGTKANVSVVITPDTTLVTTQGKTIDVKELKKGDGVGIAHDASVASKIVVNVASPR